MSGGHDLTNGYDSDILIKKGYGAYFANIAQAPASLDPLSIDDGGSILNWPDHFFGDEMVDISGQALAALRKKNSMGIGENLHYEHSHLKMPD